MDIAALTDACPFRQLTLQQLHSCLVQATAQLTERQRLVIQLRYRDELTFREISTRLEISEGAVSKLHRRALPALRTVLARMNILSLAHL